MAGPVDAASAKAVVHAGSEIAFLDVREHGQYGEGHPFLAVPCPFSRLELAAPALVPRLGVPVLLVDNGDGVARCAAEVLRGLGYRDVSWIEGGAPAWAAAGFTLFKGVNVPSKTLGELLEERWHVPHLDVETLAAWRREGRAFALFDGRPAAEHGRTTIPGAAWAPNGELAHRFDHLVTDPSVPVVVHCAGRTRSIVGAAGLALAEVANPVLALENGTQGWALSGRALEHGAVAAPLPGLDAAGREASAARARAILATQGIPLIDGDNLRRLLAADTSRTLYLLDVRTAEEVAAGTVPGAVHAPAVQLVQATDQWIGVRRARVVLLDDTGLRAAITAVFLRILGYEVSVLTGADAASRSGFERADAPAFHPSAPPELDASALPGFIASGGAVLDLRSSMAFRAGHIEGARWSIRPRLAEVQPDLARPVALVGPADVVGLAANDLEAAGSSDVRRVAGDPESWRAAGLAVTATPADPPDAEAIDFLFFVHDRHEGNMEAARRYLAWETGLVGQLDTAERDEYRTGPGPFTAA
jgi:rhodanese-related sulfurtransferase